MTSGRCSCIVYVNNKTGVEYTLEDLQNKYGYGFADDRLWVIIRSLYRTEERKGSNESDNIVFEEDVAESSSHQMPINTVVWIIDRDMTTERRWVDGYSADKKTIYLRTIQNQKKNNRGMKAYPSSAIGNYIHRNYQDARRHIRTNAVKFDASDSEGGNPWQKQN